MIYVRVQAPPPGGGSLNTIFDMTILNTGDSPDAGSEKSKIGNYDVTYREQERCAITKTKKGRIEGFPRKEYDGVDLLFLALYSSLGKERCDALLKKMKKGVKDAATQRQVKKQEGKIVYGRGVRPK
jgi:hypothetical protein